MTERAGPALRGLFGPWGCSPDRVLLRRVPALGRWFDVKG